MRLLAVLLVVVLREDHPAHVGRSHPHRGDLGSERLQVVHLRRTDPARRNRVEAHAADVVKPDVGIGFVGHRRGHPVGKAPLVGRSGERSDGLVQLGIGIVAVHLGLIRRIGRITVQRHEARFDAFDLPAAEPDRRNAHVLKIFPGLRQKRAVHQRIDLHMGMSADHHVEPGLLSEQLHVAVVAHVRHEHQQIDLRTQFGSILHRHRLRIGKLQSLEARRIARRMPRAFVVGHHADETDADAVLVQNDIGRQLRKGAGVTRHVGAHHLERHAVDHAAQKRLPVVELMVAQRRHVVAEPVHQRDHRHAGRRGHVHIGVSGPAVAGIDQHHQLRGVTTVLHGRNQSRKILNLGVHVVRREQHERPFTGRAGRSRSRKENQARPEHSFHIRRHCFSLWMKICQKYK